MLDDVVAMISAAGRIIFFISNSHLQNKASGALFCRIWAIVSSMDLFHFISITKAGQSESWRGIMDDISGRVVKH